MAVGKPVKTVLEIGKQAFVVWVIRIIGKAVIGLRLSIRIDERFIAKTDIKKVGDFRALRGHVVTAIGAAVTKVATGRTQVMDTGQAPIVVTHVTNGVVVDQALDPCRRVLPIHGAVAIEPLVLA